MVDSFARLAPRNPHHSFAARHGDGTELVAPLFAPWFFSPTDLTSTSLAWLRLLSKADAAR
jgi:hypothetical protein